MKIKISKIILSITLLSSLLLSLTSCDEKEEHKIIQYQEEVKLSDGSMIWVDIKRHYGWSGYAPGMGEGAYLPGAVEISWDTGFEGVSRQSVFFDNVIYFIDKIDEKWYIGGQRYPYRNHRRKIESINCSAYGTLVRSDDRYVGRGCILSIDRHGVIGGVELNKNSQIILNLLYAHDATNSDNYMMDRFNGKSISLFEKMQIQSQQPKHIHFIGRLYQPYIVKGDVIHD